MYDVAIIGAGINGCAIAYEFSTTNKRIAIFDKEGIASGGSGAAGAFISPKFSKAGELKELLSDAFIYSMKYYEKHFGHIFTKAPLLHLAKDEEDAQTLRSFKQNTTLKLLEVPGETREYVSIDAGIVDAKRVCEAMAKSAEFIQEEVVTLTFLDGYWLINEEYTVKEIVLATGAYRPIIREPYIQLRGIWGHRIDIQTTTQNSLSIHQFVSIAPSKDGVIAIGATHNVHYHPQTTKEPYDVTAGRRELLEKAAKTLKLEEVEVIKDYTGLRSGSFDYIPMIGPVVMAEETLRNSEINLTRKAQDYLEYSYYPGLYMINGSGGYGFVFAPYLAKALAEYIVSGKEINREVLPARFFARWARKVNS
ncbi:MAG: FAD-binding oxidoreductase [Campylobacterales bacterium]|nr:FAD-binding oxidoreductase [Campylobacterales bacterium]